MPLDAKQIVQLALASISPKGQESGMLEALVRGKLSETLNMVADQIANSPDRRLLQKNFTAAIDAPTQTADIAALLNLPEPLLLPSMGPNYAPFADCFIGTSRIFFVADRFTLERRQLNDNRVYFAIEPQTLYLNSVTPQTGTVTILGSYVPAITQVLNGSDQVIGETINAPQSLQDNIVQTLTAICKASIRPLAAA